MSRQPFQFDAIRPLLTGLLDDQLDEARRRQLIDLLRDDPAARTHYLEFMLTDAMLKVEFGGVDTRRATASSLRAADLLEKENGSALTRANTEENGFREVPVPFLHSDSSPIPPIVIQTLPSSLSPLPSFIGSPLFSYLIAAIVVGIGLTIAGLWKLSDSTQFASPSAPSSVPGRHEALPETRTPAVARITGMVDCVLKNDECRMQNAELKADIHHSAFSIQLSALHLGDRLALRSGLLELTYDTGARVILQGPVTYEIESPAGGRLSLGKLTAKLEKKPEFRDQKSEPADQKSEILRHPHSRRSHH